MNGSSEAQVAKRHATSRIKPTTHAADFFPCAGRANLKTTRDARSKCPTAFVVAKMTGSSEAQVAKRHTTFRMKPTTHAADFFPCAGRANLKTTRDTMRKCPTAFVVAKMTGSSEAQVAKRHTTFRMKPTTHAADFFPCAGRANLKTTRDARSKCPTALLLQR